MNKRPTSSNKKLNSLNKLLVEVPGLYGTLGTATWKYSTNNSSSPFKNKLAGPRVGSPSARTTNYAKANNSPSNANRKHPLSASRKKPLRTPAFPKSFITKKPPVSLKRTQASAPKLSPDLSKLVTQVPSLPKHSPRAFSPQMIAARSEVLYKEHLFSTFQALKFVMNLPPVDPSQLAQKRLHIPRRSPDESRKLVVFDLDETLVHCCDDIETSNPDFVVPITFPGGEVISAGINLRPYALECLRRANELYEVAVFTASHQCYADVVLDHLDPTRELIQHRLYRDNCIYTEGVYVKDLRVFSNWDLSQVVIIDNAVYSFAYQLDNGVPIISWQDDYHDRELFNLADYLALLTEVPDVREVNAETFHLRTFYDDYIQEVFGTGNSIVRSKSPDIIRNLTRHP